MGLYLLDKQNIEVAYSHDENTLIDLISKRVFGYVEKGCIVNAQHQVIGKICGYDILDLDGIIIYHLTRY